MLNLRQDAVEKSQRIDCWGNLEAKTLENLEIKFGNQESNTIFGILTRCYQVFHKNDSNSDGSENGAV